MSNARATERHGIAALPGGTESAPAASRGAALAPPADQPSLLDRHQPAGSLSAALELLDRAIDRLEAALAANRRRQGKALARLEDKLRERDEEIVRLNASRDGAVAHIDRLVERLDQLIEAAPETSATHGPH